MSGMVDITSKEVTERRAVAEGEISLRPRTLETIRNGEVRKGDPFEISRVAAIQAVKKTSETIPHCHPIPVTAAEVKFYLEENGVRCRCEVKATYKTGVEMEALYGVTVALLTLWDVVKYLEKDAKGQYPYTKILNIRVISKEK